MHPAWSCQKAPIQAWTAEFGMRSISSQNWLLLQQLHLENNSKKQNTDGSQIQGLQYLIV